MNDTIIIQEAIRLVNEGISVTFPVKGWSMLPFIVGGKESVILQKPEAPKVGDVVLAWVEGNRYVVHRIIRCEGHQVTLMGDGNVAGTERCTVDDVKAIATHVVDAAGRKRYLYSGWRRWAAKLWFYMRPVRRYLLAVIRRIVAS
jgi:hypothetical protein